jgi:A/G-specific adenine glycosylase
LLHPGSVARTPCPAGTALPSAGVPSALLRWFDEHRRPLPWRRDPDPYRVWVAETLLQQTRVAQAAGYFERFVARFPTVHALARAQEAEVLKAWEGAGYYARARRLRAAARVIVRDHGGRLPTTVPALESLPGVGAYTARAVASLAFGVPVVALEANGLRVAARWTREGGSLRSARVRRRLEGVLAGLLPGDRPGAFNESVMELGETVCLPRGPRCGACPVAFGCRAYRELPDPGALPRSSPRRPRPRVRAAVAIVSSGGRWLVQRRPPQGLLGGLWEFPGGRIEPGERPLAAAQRELLEETGARAATWAPAGIVRHAYSHFEVELHLFRAKRLRTAPRLSRARRWLSPKEFRRRPIPRATEKIVQRLLAPERPGATAARRARSPRARRRSHRGRRGA